MEEKEITRRGIGLPQLDLLLRTDAPCREFDPHNLASLVKNQQSRFAGVLTSECCDRISTFLNAILNESKDLMSYIDQLEKKQQRGNRVCAEQVGQQIEKMLLVIAQNSKILHDVKARLALVEQRERGRAAYGTWMCN